MKYDNLLSLANNFESIAVSYKEMKHSYFSPEYFQFNSQEEADKFLMEEFPGYTAIRDLNLGWLITKDNKHFEDSRGIPYTQKELEDLKLGKQLPKEKTNQIRNILRGWETKSAISHFNDALKIVKAFLKDQ